LFYGAAPHVGLTDKKEFALAHGPRIKSNRIAAVLHWAWRYDDKDAGDAAKLCLPRALVFRFNWQGKRTHDADRRMRGRYMSGYSAYGLGIDSSLELPELVKTETRPDVVIQLGPVDFSKRPQDADGSDWVWATRDRACFFIEGMGRFQVDNGERITVDLEKGIEEGQMRIYLLGPVLSLLLHQRGYLLLHSSCIALPEGAVAFVARKGTGKSTVATAFVKRGFPIVADDLIAVDVSGQTPIVHPGFPQIKLLPDAMEGLGEDPTSAPLLNSLGPKRGRRAEKFSDCALPLRRVYALMEGGQRQAVETLGGHAAFRVLCDHSYVMPLLRTTGSIAHHFEQTASLVNQKLVRRLLRRREHSALHELVNLVQDDVQGEKQ